MPRNSGTKTRPSAKSAKRKPVVAKKRLPNKGSFQPGPDARRHKFTPSDCRVGWLVANIKHPHLREWLKRKVCIYVRLKGLERHAT